MQKFGAKTGYFVRVWREDAVGFLAEGSGEGRDREPRPPALLVEAVGEALARFQSGGEVQPGRVRARREGAARGADDGHFGRQRDIL